MDLLIQVLLKVLNERQMDHLVKINQADSDIPV